jgi:upstream activation factor subunit UAF30
MTLQTAFGCAQGLCLGLGSRGPLASASRLGRRAASVFAAAAPAVPARRMPAVSRPLVPSRELQAFVPDKAQPRSAVLKILSAYVKENGLQDPVKKTVVNCDGPLRALFGVDSCTFLGMSKYISPHLRKPEEVGGKYLEEARLFEEAWAEENAGKVVSKKKVAKRGTVSSEEAKANGTGLWAPVKLSADLSKVCGSKAELPRQEVVKAVWDYIRAHKLQGKAGEPVRCDAALKTVFKSDTVTARQIMGGIGSHLTKVAK